MNAICDVHERPITGWLLVAIWITGITGSWAIVWAIWELIAWAVR